MRVALILAALLHLADLVATTPDHKEETLDTAHLAEITPDQAVDLVQAAEETLDTAHRLEFQQDMADQPSTQNQPQLAAHATKDRQDLPDQKARTEILEKMETTARTARTEKMLNCWLQNQPKFALSAHKARKARQDHQEQKDLQDRRDLQESLHVMVCQENKEWQEVQANKVDQAAKDHAEHQDSPVDLFQFPDLRGHQDNQASPENPDQRVNQAPMDRASKDRRDFQVMPEPPERKEDLDRPELLGRPEKKARKDPASTAHLHVPRLAIDNTFHRPLFVDQRRMLLPVFYLSVYIVQSKTYAFVP